MDRTEHTEIKAGKRRKTALRSPAVNPKKRRFSPLPGLKQDQIVAVDDFRFVDVAEDLPDFGG